MKGSQTTVSWYNCAEHLWILCHRCNRTFTMLREVFFSEQELVCEHCGNSPSSVRVTQTQQEFDAAAAAAYRKRVSA